MRRPIRDSMDFSGASVKHGTQNIQEQLESLSHLKHGEIAEKAKILTTVRERIPILTQLLLSAPQFSLSSSLIFVHVYIILYYESLGADFASIAAIIGISRCLDVIIDPVIAHKVRFLCCEEDKDDVACPHMNKTRMYTWLAGIVVLFFSFVLLLSVGDGHSASFVSAYHVVLYLLFIVSYSCVSIPYSTMVSETSRNREPGDRTVLYLLSNIWENAGLFLLFLVCGFATFNSQAADAFTSSTCLSPSGVARSCSALPGLSGALNTYYVYNASLWSLPANDTAAIASLNSTCRYFQGVVLQSPSELYSPQNCQYYGSNGCLSQYCQCLSECASLTDITASTGSFMAAGIVFGLVLAGAMGVLIWHTYGGKVLDDLFDAFLGPSPATIAQRSHTTLAETIKAARQPFIPSIIGIWRNPLFGAFVTPWFLDTLSYLLVLCSMYYFVVAAIQPEFASVDDGGGRDCNQGIPIPGTASDDWECKSPAVTGVILAMVSLAMCLSAPLWFYLSTIIGRTRTWQVGSLISMLCVLAFVFTAQRGKAATAVVLGLLLGTGFGHRFLGDVVCADVADHDEFISGQRNDSVFAMLKSSSVKLAALLSTLLPLAVLMALGWNGSYNSAAHSYMASVQNDRVRNFCIMVTVGIPAMLSLLSYVLKLRLRLRVDPQSEMIAYGIRMHMLKRASYEPLSGVEYPPAAPFSLVESDIVHLLNHFPGLEAVVDFRACVEANAPQIAIKLLRDRTRDRLGVVFISGMGCLVAIILTGKALTHKTGFFIVPVMFIVLLGYMLALGFFYFRKLLVVFALRQPGAVPSVSVLDKLIKNRGALADMTRRGTSGRQVKDIVRIFREKRRMYLEHLRSQQGLSKRAAASEAAAKAREAREAAVRALARDAAGGQEVEEEEDAEISALDRESRLIELNLARLMEKTTKQDALLAKSKADTVAAFKKPPLTAWDVEMYSYVLEQEMDNAEAAARADWRSGAGGGRGSEGDDSKRGDGDGDDDDQHGEGTSTDLSTADEEEEDEDEDGDTYNADADLKPLISSRPALSTPAPAPKVVKKKAPQQRHRHEDGEDDDEEEDDEEEEGAVRIDFKRLTMNKDTAAALNMFSNNSHKAALAPAPAPVRRANASMYQSRQSPAAPFKPSLQSQQPQVAPSAANSLSRGGGGPPKVAGRTSLPLPSQQRQPISRSAVAAASNKSARSSASSSSAAAGGGGGGYASISGASSDGSLSDEDEDE